MEAFIIVPERHSFKIGKYLEILPTGSVPILQECELKEMLMDGWFRLPNNEIVKGGMMQAKESIEKGLARPGITPPEWIAENWHPYNGFKIAEKLAEKGYQYSLDEGKTWHTLPDNNITTGESMINIPGGKATLGMLVPTYVYGDFSVYNEKNIEKTWNFITSSKNYSQGKIEGVILEFPSKPEENFRYSTVNWHGLQINYDMSDSTQKALVQGLINEDLSPNNPLPFKHKKYLYTK
jgi:hypothetical protein